MRGRARYLATYLACLLLLGGPALAMGGENEEKETTAAPPSSTAAAQEMEAELPGFQVTGDFNTGFRWTDVSGSENKYFEDLNYRTGPRLFNLNFDITPVGSEFFNLLNIYASHLGGDPFETFGVTLQKFGSYEFRYRRNKSTFFYHDTILPVGVSDPSEADPTKVQVGDFHTFNFDRQNDTIDFDFDVTERGRVFVNFNRQSRVGESTTTVDVSRDEFELDEPLEQIKDDYTLGFQIATEKVSFYFDETYRDYEDDGRMFLPGASPGEGIDDPTELFFFEQLLPFDFTMPQSTVRLNLRPQPNLTVNVGYIRSDLDGEFDYSERAQGVAFTGAPLVEDIAGRGEMDRTTNLANVDIVYDVNERVSVLGAARFRRFDQEASFRCLFGPCAEADLEAGQVADTAIDVDSDIYEIGARVHPSAAFQVTGGFRFEDRAVTVMEEGELEEEPNTERTTFFVNGVVSTSPLYNVMAEYELGDYDNPFTRISPTSLDRFKLRVRVFPRENLTVTGMAHTRRIDNTLTDADFSTDNYTLYLRYGVEDVAFYGGYTRQEFSGNIINEITTLPGFQGGLTFDIASIYEYNVDIVTGGFNYGFTDFLRAGVDLNVYTNDGSFPLDWRQFQVFGDFLSPAGYLVRLAYQRNSYDEDQFDFDDYDSNIVTVSIGYRF